VPPGSSRRASRSWPPTTSLDAAARANLTKVYADKSVELIRDAIKSGYGDTQALVSDHAFDALRPRADYQALVAPLAAPPKP
jgi:hypothetical protein